MSKTLIAYFSRSGENFVNGNVESLPTGNTELIAQIIEDQTAGDMFKIQTTYDYPADYKECTEVAKEELKNHMRPEVKDMPESIDEYENVIVGFPNWWDTMPMAVYTFLEEYNWSGKNVLPFCTHEGGGAGNSEKEIIKICQGADVKPILVIQGANAADAAPQVKEWLDKNMPNEKDRSQTH